MTDLGIAAGFFSCRGARCCTCLPLSASRDVPHHTEAGGGQAETAAPTVLAAAVAQPSTIPHVN
jgi:hypothetical protein